MACQPTPLTLLRETNGSGQIIATSHDLTPNGGLGREISLFQGNPGWCNIIVWPEGFIKGNQWSLRKPMVIKGRDTLPPQLTS